MTELQLDALQARADALSDRYPVGTPVRYWPGAREGEGTLSRVRSRFWLLGHGAIVCAVAGYRGGIALTHLQFDGPEVPRP